MSELRALADHCNFGTNLEDMLGNRLVCGVMDDRIKRRLLAVSELSYKKAMEIQQSVWRQLIKNLQVLQASEATSTLLDSSKDIHHMHSKVNKKPQARTSPVCYHCGKTNHTSFTCYILLYIVI